VTAVYIGALDRATIYIGELTDTAIYLGVDSLWPAVPIDVKWNASTGQSGIAVSTDGYRASTTSGYAQHGVLGAPAIPTTGKWWVEYISDNITATTTHQGVGIANDTTDFGNLLTGAYLFITHGSKQIHVKYGSTEVTVYGGVTWASGVNIVGMGYDADANTVIFRLNNRATVGPYDLSALGPTFYPAFWAGLDGACGWTINSGRLAWTYAPPAGFSALQA